MVFMWLPPINFDDVVVVTFKSINGKMSGAVCLIVVVYSFSLSTR